MSNARSGLEQAYWERNQLVLALTKVWPARIGIDPEEPEWPVIYIDSPAGQLSWHIREDEVSAYFGHLALSASGAWDGHTTSEKYDRLRSLEVR